MAKQIRKQVASIRQPSLVKASYDREGDLLAVPNGASSLPVDALTFSDLLDRTRRLFFDHFGGVTEPAKLVFDDFVRGSENEESPLMVFKGSLEGNSYSAGNLAGQPAVSAESDSFESLVEKLLESTDEALSEGRHTEFGLPEKPRVRLVFEASL